MSTRALILTAATLVALHPSARADEAARVSGPDLSKTNRHYVNNRPPLQPNRFIGLPLGSVTPQGWVREFLVRQREGLTGHLGEISAWLQKEDNAWLSKDGKGKYGWEELPYWFKGYIELAYALDDPKMIAESKIWIEGALASQRPDGDFGPDQRFEDGSRDYWANMIMMFCLESYYDVTKDQRVLDLMSRYFKYQMTIPDEKMLTHYWQKMRGGDNLYAIHWLYNRTGEADLLKLAEKIDRCTANWRMKDDLPNWHNVNIAECFREPGQFFVQSKDPKDLQFAYANFLEVRKRYGQVPGGMFGSDENCRPGYDDPHQAVETCGMVEQMLSDALLFQISGDRFWADHCEEVAFNSYPAAVMPDFKALRYLTAPNQVVSDAANHAPGVQNGGPFMVMNPFSCRCCQHNHSHGWPYFNKHLWMATPDDGLCAALYSASEVKAKVAEGTEVTITEETQYPFEETVRFRLRVSQPVAFPLYLRVPSWCADPQVAINDTPTGLASDKPGQFVLLRRTWKDGDRVTLKLPMAVTVKRWARNHNSASVNYGPLTFSLLIGERYERKDSAATAIGDSSWQKGADPSKWPSYEIFPTTPWNYALVLDGPHAEMSLSVKRGQWPANNFPFTTSDVPLRIQAKARKLPEWTLDRHGLCGVLQDSPARTTEPVEEVTLIPMGAARLRISAFPVAGTGSEARAWTAPKTGKPSPYKTSASHCFGSDTVNALGDGLEPASSGDHEIPRLTFWDHRGGTEWVQYDFPSAKDVSAVEVYWFDDIGVGQCRLPKDWRVLYQDGGQWKPVSNVTVDPVTKDKWNAAKFTPVKTTALRLEINLQPGFSGGILEWKVKESR